MQQFLKKNLSTILILAVFALLLFNPGAKAFVLKTLMLTGVFNAGTAKEPAHSNSKAIPLVFADSKGTRINTAELKGKVLFINFWAAWCPPCIAEMGSINALYNKLKADPRFIFIMVDADSDLPAAGAFMTKHGYNLPVYRVAASVPADLYGGSLPTTLIIDASGVLVQKHEGIARYDTRNMELFMQSLALPAAQ